MDNPLVSIIIPLYNTEKYIEKAINSVINQTYTNWQLIIIDDCSTDSSLEIVMNIRKSNKFSNEKIVIKRMTKNMGTYVALNIALKLAKGKYFCILGSDDIYIPEKLQIQIDEFTKNPNYVCVAGKYIRKDLKENICEDINVSKQQMQRGIMGECTCMYLTSIIKNIGYYDCVRYGADTNYIYRVYKCFGKDRVCKINKILYTAVQRPNRLTIASTKRNRNIYVSTFKKWLGRGNYYIGFPLKKRPYNVPTDMLP